MVGLVVAVSGPGGVAHSAQVVFPVGMRQVEFVDRTSDAGDRTLAMRVFYPAEAPPPGARPMRTPFFTGLTVYSDLPPATGGARHPLILFLPRPLQQRPAVRVPHDLTLAANFLIEKSFWGPLVDASRIG